VLALEERRGHEQAQRHVLDRPPGAVACSRSSRRVQSTLVLVQVPQRARDGVVDDAAGPRLEPGARPREGILEAALALDDVLESTHGADEALRAARSARHTHV